MMKNRHCLIAFLVLFFIMTIFLIACEKDNSTESVGLTGPTGPTGNQNINQLFIKVPPNGWIQTTLSRLNSYHPINISISDNAIVNFYWYGETKDYNHTWFTLPVFIPSVYSPDSIGRNIYGNYSLQNKEVALYLLFDIDTIKWPQDTMIFKMVIVEP
jgi:hypothetical protein